MIRIYNSCRENGNVNETMIILNIFNVNDKKIYVSLQHVTSLLNNVLLVYL